MNKNKIMNNLDKQYTALLQDILDNGTKKNDRTGTGTISVFGRQIRHKMLEGFPLLTTKKMYWKGIVTELLWFLLGDTNIKYLVDNDCHIWDGDAYKNYENKMRFAKKMQSSESSVSGSEWNILSKEEFINKIKTDDEFAKLWGNLGSVYGKQWRRWAKFGCWDTYDALFNSSFTVEGFEYIDQITNLINKLKTNPDDRRMMVTAWNPAEVDDCVLPPCHYGFQVYTRELSDDEIVKYYYNNIKPNDKWKKSEDSYFYFDEDSNMWFEHSGSDILFGMRPKCPKRAISLMYNCRSQDVPLGTPFNIASYGLLLEIIAKIVNMVPDELIANMGDCHIYLNQIDGVKEQIGRELTLDERIEKMYEINKKDTENLLSQTEPNHILFDSLNVPKRTREPYPLPQLRINTEFWLTKSGECGVGDLTDDIDELIKGIQIDDFQIENYKSHPSIKFPLSN